MMIMRKGSREVTEWVNPGKLSILTIAFPRAMISYVCNGVVDCADGRDEMLCGEMLCTSTTECQEELIVTNSSCSIMHYRCLSGDCIRLDQLCDWRADCPDNSDEGHCNALSDVHVHHIKRQIKSDSIFQVNTTGMTLIYGIVIIYLT